MRLRSILIAFERLNVTINEHLKDEATQWHEVKCVNFRGMNQIDVSSLNILTGHWLYGYVK